MGLKSSKDSCYLGVDGCKAGWFVVGIKQNEDWAIDIFSDIGAIWQQFSKFASLILIDIPIGLPENGIRVCDKLARKVLKQRASSVFPVPCRKATQAKNYKNACRINHQIIKKKLSMQSWNIAPKIKELDALLGSDPKKSNYIRESHPEVCFWALSGGRPMNWNKKTDDGYLQRRNILQCHYPQSEKIIQTALAKFARKHLSKDDILDAIVLAVTAAAPPQTRVTLPESPPKDARQLPMEIVYSNRRLHLS